MFRIKRPFVPFFVSIITTCFLIMEEFYDTVLFLVLLTSVICAVLAVRKLFISKYILIILSGIIIATVAFAYNNSFFQVADSISGYNVNISGTVASNPENLSGRRYFEITDCSVADKDIYGKIGVFTSSNKQIQAGDRITATADSLYPAASDDIFRFHSISERVYLNAFCYNDSETVSENYKDGIYYKITRLADKINTKISENMSVEGAAVTKALLTGNRSTLSNEQSSAIKTAGVSHIFAVSGMHLSLWTGIFFIILKNRSRSSFIPNFLSIAFVIFYSILTGLSPSVLRAGIMLTAVFTARIVRRQADALNSLGLAGSILLIANPFLSGNISFLLSTASTFTLVYIADLILPSFNLNRTEKIKSFFKKLLQTVLVSLAVIFMCLPFSSIFFGSVSMLSPVYSLILTPVAQALMSFSAAAILLPSGFVLSEFCFLVCEFLSNIINTAVFYSKNFDFAVIPVDKNIIIPWFTVTFVIILLFIYIKNSKRTAVAFVLISSILLSGFSLSDTYKNRNNTDIFIPLSTNVTLIAIYSKGESIIFGCGGDYDDTDTLSKFFSKNGEYFIDTVFIPRESTYDSENYENIKQRFNPSHTENLSSKIFECEIRNDFTVKSHSDDGFCAAALNIDGVKIVICSLPSSDFSSCAEIYKSGDILITRNRLPKNINTENFSDIIIMTDNIYSTVPTNAKTTINGGITVTLKGESYVIN